jgi:hypothetical protein
MSQSSDTPVYAIVLWIGEVKCHSVISTKYVDYKEMLYDNQLKGLVSYPNGKREPVNGWPKYERVVLRLRGKGFVDLEVLVVNV